MSHQGRIIGWKDERGFGFIAPSAGGDQAFVHISSFVNRDRRPKDDDLVTYALARDRKGRMQAVQVSFSGDTTSHGSDSRVVLRAIVIAATSFFILGACVAMGVFPPGLFLICSAMSIVAFVMYWYDKSASRIGRWRTRESTLHLVGLFGGWPGALVAMQVFRHKSSKQSFRNAFWVTVVANCGALIWLATPSGSSILKSIMDSV
jgi:uncharacterized membrane protein YsdA (DUF1294 family)/cold shock CspA family protein